MVIIYFSGTGNSEFVAKRFGKITNCKAYSIEENVDFSKIIGNNKIITLCFPIHFSRSPIFFQEFLVKHKEDFSGKKIISFATQQAYSGDGAKSVSYVLDNVEVIYAEHFNMQNNITSMPLYYKLTKRNNKRCLIKTNQKLRFIANEVLADRRKLKGFSKFGELIGKTQNMGDDTIVEKRKNAVKINKDCILCNKCVMECPTNNLENIDSLICSNDSCTFCVRCVNICPKKAITVLIHGKVKEQYDIRNIVD